MAFHGCQFQLRGLITTALRPDWTKRSAGGRVGAAHGSMRAGDNQGWRFAFSPHGRPRPDGFYPSEKKMTPDSCGLQVVLTFVALLPAALGAVLLFKGAREDPPAAPLDPTDARVRIGDGASVLRFRLETQPSGRTAFRADTRRA